MLRHQGLLYYLFHEYNHIFKREEIGVDELIYLFQPFSFKPQAARVLLSRLKKKQLIANRRQGKKSYYFLTEEGKKRLAWGWGQLFNKQPLEWNGHWRLVVYNIPEKIRKRRDEFRLYLMFNGYGSLNNSVWVCPEGKGEAPLGNLLEKVNSLGIGDYVEIFTAQKIGLGNDKAMIAKAYNLQKMMDQYEVFLKKYCRKMDTYRKLKKRGEGIQIEEYYVERFELGLEFLDLIKLDPKLPKELLPSQWNGWEAEALFLKYIEMLGEYTYSYFGRKEKTGPAALAIFPN